MVIARPDKPGAGGQTLRTYEKVPHRSPRGTECNSIFNVILGRIYGFCHLLSAELYSVIFFRCKNPDYATPRLGLILMPGPIVEAMVTDLRY